LTPGDRGNTPADGSQRLYGMLIVNDEITPFVQGQKSAVLHRHMIVKIAGISIVT